MSTVTESNYEMRELFESNDVVPIAWMYKTLYHFLTEVGCRGIVIGSGIVNSREFFYKYDRAILMHRRASADTTDNTVKDAFDAVVEFMGSDEYFDYSLPTMAYRVSRNKHQAGVVVMSGLTMPYSSVKDIILINDVLDTAAFNRYERTRDK